MGIAGIDRVLQEEEALPHVIQDLAHRFALGTLVAAALGGGGGYAAAGTVSSLNFVDGHVQQLLDLAYLDGGCLVAKLLGFYFEHA